MNSFLIIFAIIYLTIFVYCSIKFRPYHYYRNTITGKKIFFGKFVLREGKLVALILVNDSIIQYLPVKEFYKNYMLMKDKV